MATVPRFHKLQVVRLRTEGLNGKAITLHVPEALRQTFAFKAGQYMVVRADISGQSCRRSYSVCSTPERLLSTGEIDIGVRAVTDGVFSGKKGFYHENSHRDDHTLYGQSKKFGETSSRNVLGLRCSLIGEQSESHNQYLLEWLKSRPRNCTINGYENYIWNGVTTNAFSRIVSGIIESDSKIFGSFHLNPSDYCSKFDLLKLLADKYKRTDIRINQSRLSHSLNRTLSTNYPDQNSWFWKIGKYHSVPSITELVNEI
jgi:hypothetical protein